MILDGAGAPVACTVVARNYLPAARVLARSYLAHHPDHRFVVAVIDADRDKRTERDGFLVVGPAAFDIGAEDYLRMATAYSVTELATAVKPYLLRRLRAEAEVVTYLDPDIQVFAPMRELVELAREHGIVLTPHFLTPLPRDGREPAEAMIMGAGIFNLGFVAVGPGSEPFLDFWAERLRHDAIVAPERQLFTDQRWVDQVPALFGHHVLRDPGFNVAYWNLHEREVERDAGGALTVSGRPLRFFHFSGYRPETPWILTSYCVDRPRTLLSAHPELRALCDAYGALLRESGYAETLDAVPYGFATMPDGTKLTQSMRRLFRDEWVSAERKGKPLPPHPFGADGGAAFRDWLTAPVTPEQANAGLNRWAYAVWQARTDLQLAFPHPCGRDAERFRGWCRTSGAAEEAIAEWALPIEPPTPRAPDDEFGVNVLGYLTAELGVGEMGRLVHDAIERAGVPLVSIVEDRLLPNRAALDSPDTLGEPRFPVSLLCVNADQTAVMLDNHPEVAHRRYRIGLWAWELEEFPASLHEAFRLVDEVWTVSEFCREAIARHSPVPVRAVPVPVRVPDEVPRTGRRPGDPVRFLFAFDFNSVGERKNPWGLVDAFRQAFPDRDDVRLVLKAINGNRNPRAAERLRVKVAGDRRIELVERYLSVAELDQLYASSTCYVSLHRSEGFGLTVAEAMARGMPVIATDYAGTAEFLDHTTGWPVPYRMVEVGPGCAPYDPKAMWAEPDLRAAAAAMRAVADDPEEAARRGRAAREHLLRTRSLDAAARWLRERLEAAYQNWRGRTETPAPTPGSPLRPLHDARQALHWRAEPSAPSRTPLAPALRRAVLRAIDHYDVHQRRVMGALVDGVERTVGNLLDRLTSVEAQLRATQQAAARAERAADAVSALQRTVDELRMGAPGTALALHNLEADVAAVREALTVESAAREAGLVNAQQLADHVDALRMRVEETDKKTFEMFVDRDRRIDTDEQALRQLRRDLAAVHQAAAQVHAPLPPGAEAVVCDAGVLLVPRDDVFLPWLAYHRSWETGEADLMAELAGGRTFLDIGAHIGYHTLRLLRRCPELPRVVAVEANPANAELLRRNVAVNLPAEIAERVAVLPVAAWDAEGTVRLVQVEADNSGDHRVLPSGDAGVEVPAVRLGSRPEVAGDPVGLVKVDLQGRDHRALAGLVDVLRRDRPHVVCEFCPSAIDELGDDPADVLAAYRKLGYHPVPVSDDGPVRGDHTDDALITGARESTTGFLTLWLRPD
ncbi:FkbM family methyltransferase [Gandjariella thermophila]|uniref:FkbM family methyltransferase n=1 Tax=Gandjariella thermophila TaxID=1931992 RepID=UPI001CEF6FF1|nr:FkbM family methyltransferase [Gandjariella thermophila]